MTPKPLDADRIEPEAFFTACVRDLRRESEIARCDGCGAELRREPTEASTWEEGERGGCGVLLWSRGEERRCEKRPLCAACATIFGLSALARWEIEEEEG